MGLHFTAGWWSLLNKGAMLKVRLSLFTSVSAYGSKNGMEVKRHENRRLGFKSLKEVKIKKCCMLQVIITVQLLHDKLCNYCNCISKYCQNNLHKIGTKTDQKQHFFLSQLPPKYVRSYLQPHNFWTFSGGGGGMPPYPLRSLVLWVLDLRALATLDLYLTTSQYVENTDTTHVLIVRWDQFWTGFFLNAPIFLFTILVGKLLWRSLVKCTTFMDCFLVHSSYAGTGPLILQKTTPLFILLMAALS